MLMALKSLRVDILHKLAINIQTVKLEIVSVHNRSEMIPRKNREDACKLACENSKFD